MITVHDTITGDELTYEDIEDFRETARNSFDESVWPQLDELCDAYAAHGYIGELEVFLGITIEG